jgi:hypothetical protein
MKKERQKQGSQQNKEEIQTKVVQRQEIPEEELQT